MMEEGSEQAVAELLGRLFSQDELLDFIYKRWPDLIGELPARNTSKAKVTYLAARALARYGLLDDQLFSLLRELRPQRVREIDEVARRLQGGRGPSPAPRGRDPMPEAPGPPTGAALRLGLAALAAVGVLILGISSLLHADPAGGARPLAVAAGLAALIGAGLGLWRARGKPGVKHATGEGPRSAEPSPVLFLPPYAGPEPLYGLDRDALAGARLREASRLLLQPGLSPEQRAELQEKAAIARALLRAQGGPPVPGEVVGPDRYLLLHWLGQGAITSTWRAWDLRLDRLVAVKLFQPYLSADPAALARLVEPLRQLAGMDHPGLERVLDLDVRDPLSPGYAVEYLPGGSLEDQVQREERPRAEVLAGLLPVAEALAYAHARGLVHRNINPRAVRYDPSGRARLVEFVARHAEAEGSGTRASSTFVFAYAPPELFSGIEHDPRRADQWSLAMTLLFVLRGGPPRRSPLGEGFVAEIEALLAPEGAVGAALRRALRPDPDERFPSTEGFVEALREALREAPPAAPDPSPSEALGTNPFQPGNPLRTGRLPPGRADTAEQLRARVEASGSVALLGPRRAGKTSLLLHLEQRLAADHPTRRVSLERVRCRTADDLAVAIAPELRGHASPSDGLYELLAREARWPCLLIDEVGYLRNALLDADPSVFGWLRGIGQEVASVVYAGSPNDWSEVMRHAAQQPGSSFGNDVAILSLGQLRPDAALAFLEDTAPRDVRIPSEPTGRWILEYCGTWPFYLQLMGYEIVQEARAGRRAVLDDVRLLGELYERALLRAYSPMFQERWDDLPPQMRRILLQHQGVLPSFESLGRPDRDALTDALQFDGLSGWALASDRPFLDWIRRKLPELRGEEAP